MEDKLLTKVSKLLAQAQGAGVTEAESLAFTERAMALMAKHGIEEAMLADKAPSGPEPAVTETITVPGPYAMPKFVLLCNIARSFDCRAVRYTGGYDTVIAGRKSDIERAKFLWTSVVIQATRLLAYAKPDSPHVGVKTYRRSWLLGYAHRVDERLRHAKDSAVREEPSGRAELVLASNARRAEAAIQERFGGRIRMTSISSNAAGFRAGRLAGNSADLGQARMGGGRQRALR